MLPLLSENSQTCKVQPPTSIGNAALIGTMEDGKHLDGYRLDVQFPRPMPDWQVDTAASGIFITKALADANGLSRTPTIRRERFTQITCVSVRLSFATASWV